MAQGQKSVSDKSNGQKRAKKGKPGLWDFDELLASCWDNDDLDDLLVDIQSWDPGDLATWDADALADLLADTETWDLDALGTFDNDALDALLAEIENLDLDALLDVEIDLDDLLAT